MANPIPRPHEAPNTGAEEVPPGATRKAFDRPEEPSGGAPGSGAGPRHASGDPGDGSELNDSRQRHHEDLGPFGAAAEMKEDQPPYAGHAGGAVGGSPAEGRSSGGRTHGGIDPGGIQRGDSTIGAKPNEE